MNHAWQLALKNLRRNRRRNVATAVSIALGFGGLVLIGGYAVRVERFLRTNTVYLQQTGHLSIYKEGGLERGTAQPATYALSAEEQQVIATVLSARPEVEFFGRHLVGMGLAGNGCTTLPFAALGVEPGVQARALTHPEVLLASPELSRPVKGELIARYPAVEGAVALSAGLAELLGKTRVHDEVPAAAAQAEVVLPDCTTKEGRGALAHDANVQLAGLTWSGSMSAVDTEVVNVFHTPLAETDDGTVVASLQTLQSLYDTDAISYLSVYLRDARDTSRMRGIIEDAIRAAGVPVRAYTFDDERVGPYYAGTMPFLSSLVGFIGLLVAAVVVLSIVNAMTLSILERTRELGMLRALGFNRRQVLGLCLREAALLTALAVGVGLLIALCVAAMVNNGNVRFSPPGVPGTIQFMLTPTPALCAALAAFIVPLSVAAAWLAVRRTTRAGIVSLLSSHSS
ncbi:MAG: ABC transporter permease [Deltaproteobacteria bacterium]|nr:ABC transporter permease [Deltaproteobacteria bacterium]